MLLWIGVAYDGKNGDGCVYGFCSIMFEVKDARHRVPHDSMARLLLDLSHIHSHRAGCQRT
jgi:hypothetical protein